MHVLDLGCGRGCDLDSWGVTASDRVTALDPEGDRLRLARARFPSRIYLQGVGEFLPFADETFDLVVASVALPYMNIPRALEEIRRVLVPGGRLAVSLHLPSFTFSELVRHALPRPLPTIYRLYVVANGCVFHTTGRTIGFGNGRTESFQTRRGMSIALRRAGLVDPAFTVGHGPGGKTFTVRASRPSTESLERPAAA